MDACEGNRVSTWEGKRKDTGVGKKVVLKGMRLNHSWMVRKVVWGTWVDRRVERQVHVWET